MEITEILQHLERATGKFPQAAVEAAVARREEITPELLRILEDTIERAPQLFVEHDYIAHLYAMSLLAQFRETRAFPLVVRLCLLPGDFLHLLCGIFLAEGVGRVLASVCGGRVEGIQSIIENEDADGVARGTAIRSLVSLVAAGEMSRDEAVSYFASLFRGKLVRECSLVWNTLVESSAKIYPAELLEDIEKAFEEDLVATRFITFEEVEDYLSMGKERILARLAADSSYRLVQGTEEEMSWWLRLHERRQAGARAASRVLQNAYGARLLASSQIRRAKSKTGRNEPCPCGSGKKYKRCCGA
jgi:hypothetical protein